MHRPQPSNGGTGGLFKSGSIFGGSKTPTSMRPTTSSGSPTTHSELHSHSSTTSKASRKASFSNSKGSQRGRKNSTAHSTNSPEKKEKKRSNSAKAHTDRHPLPVTVIPVDRESKPVSAESIKQVVPAGTETVPSPPSGTDSFTSTKVYSNMLARPGTGYQAPSPGGPPIFAMPPQQPSSATLETITYQHIQETSSKRISTLDYLRKAHEGRVYWFNTLLFNKPDLQRMPYFDTRKLARRATNYLLLGLSLPTIIDLNGSSSLEFLKTLNSLLLEFESFQQIHPPDGSLSSLSRGRIPQMFKRATATSGKGRRQSSAAEIGLPMGNEYSDSKSTNGSITSAGGNSATSFPLGETDLLPGEEYTYLLTPSLPFDPDFYETFATLCDVLIDCYTKITSLVASPKECSPVVAEMFTKADAKVRKIIVQGVVKEFEDSSRGGVKSEVAGVGRVVLGGLM